MVYSYLTKLDKQVNETLILYKNLAKLTQPMIKYLIFILSFLIFTSCFILLYYCFIHSDNISNNNVSNNVNNNVNNNFNTTSNNNLFTNVILPIILYGLLCPILSSILSSICKLFFDNIVQKIKTKHLCFKHIIKHNNIYNYLFFHKLNIIYPLFFIFIYNLNNYIKCIYVLTYFCIQFNRIFIFYTNSIDCRIISIEKCYNNNDNFWNFELEINTNSEKKTVFKRFNDFKKLSNNTLYNNIKLPTSSWLFKPTNINDVTQRAVELNKYIEQITTHDSLLQDSVFFNFINDTKEERNNIVLEKEFINSSNSDSEKNLEVNYNNIYSNINIIKNKCKLLLKQPIKNIFIFHEINYFNTLKKRIFIVTQDSIYKIKYYITQNIFEIRIVIPISNIKYVEYSRINNTTTLCDESILIIYYNSNDNIKITSLNKSYYYNINSILELLKSLNIHITYIDNIDLDNGFGITENIFNNSLFHSIKDSYYNSYLYFNK
jgi:hypothetical protein|tara:strand:- start:119 stop:1588 length:1470 start_codon:yes stop_codon:yes gene_type:complete